MHWSWPRQHSDCHDLWQSATTQAVQKLSLLNAAAQSAPTVTSGTKHTKIKSTALEGRKEGRKEREKGQRHCHHCTVMHGKASYGWTFVGCGGVAMAVVEL